MTPGHRQADRHRAWLLALLLGFAPIGPAAAQAADAPAPDSAPVGEPAEEPDADKPANAEAADAAPAKPRPAQPGAEGKKNPGVFIPTEEISEDFAVSFPVDI